MMALMGTTSMTEARELSRRFAFPDHARIPEQTLRFTKPAAVGKTETLVDTPVMKQDSVLLPRTGELFGRLLDRAMVTEPMIEAVLEASGQCGVQLERWQAKVLAGASMAASDLLWWPPGESGLLSGRASSASRVAPGSPSARSVATAQTGSGRGPGRRFG
jgi:hypothetical protein